ncbi:MAG: PD-(D/E)XK nuclease family protein [Clostridia bacterium]|nr:PD-(D/E)XK nuclease family protein [Clostridia bacterium]
MIKAICCPAVSSALEGLKKIISSNREKGKRTVIFCEDRLTLAAERTVCAAVGGTFSASIYTFARFLSSERGRAENVLTSQGSAMAIRRIIEENKKDLKLFNKLSAAAAAGAVYDTIALLYSSKISADDAAKAAAEGLLESKLHDVALIYSAYDKYLQESGKIDRNAYLRELPEVISQSEKIKGSDVVFLAFQSFTRSSADCVRAAFGAAESVYGLFIGGSEEIYVNEALAVFEGAANEFGGAKRESFGIELSRESEILRKSLFNPESFYNENTLNSANVHIFEAADSEEELEFIAASIKKFVLDSNERYANISVMLPDVEGAERELRRVFSQYRIPYYADRRHALSEHPVASFITGYLSCVSSGCTFADVDGVIASPMFPASAEDKDEYRNYALRLALFRGGIKREPDGEILKNLNFSIEAVQRVREVFLRGLKFLPASGNTQSICTGLKKLLEDFGAEQKLMDTAEKFKDEYPAEAEFSGRVYEAALSVLAEAESITGGAKMPLKEFIKILKSGFGAAEISLIPPKADAVFVGDVAATANTGSNVVFAARLTGDVPCTSSDTSLLCDREIAALEKVNLEISPKIYQVNMRRRELTALNICAFRRELYLSYPVRSDGEENTASEIISYVCAAIKTPSGAPLKPLNLKRLEKTNRALPYYCSEKVPALKRLLSVTDGAALSSVYSVLEDNGFKAEADEAMRPPVKPQIKDGKQLFVSYNSITPTTLETYFSCPYRNFIQQGLRLQEREEGAMRPVDTGNFIHAVLQKIAPEFKDIKDKQSAQNRAMEIAEGLLKVAPYSSLASSKSGEYAAAELIAEAGEIGAGTYEQLANSKFEIESSECKCEIPLGGDLKLFGRIDRVDACGDMVRVIDYKTGTADASTTKYYMGLKLQLPLYLTATSVGRRAVGAYYFPASVEYKSQADGVFRLQGFMDGSDDVVSVSDTTLNRGEKSAYFDAYLGGGRSDKAMPADVFADFLQYSLLVSRQGAKEMLEGNVAPSPAEDACKYCKAGGSCGFAVGYDGEERTEKSVKCGGIAKVVRKARGDI